MAVAALTGTKDASKRERMTVGRPGIGSIETGITAHAGGTKAAALALTASYNVLSVCATNGDSVLLPADRKVGDQVEIANDGAANAQVFGAGSDTIDGVSTATGVVLTAAKRCVYTVASIDTSNVAAWISNMGVKSA